MEYIVACVMLSIMVCVPLSMVIIGIVTYKHIKHLKKVPAE